MITFLEGSLEEKTPTCIALNVGGVGYEIFVPLSTFDALPATGEKVRLLIFDYLREDQHILYGFAKPRERAAFMMLIGVNGIGPKLALTTLSRIHVRDLCDAIAGGDTRRLASVSGIGKRLAERMVVELKDRAVAVSGEIAAVSGAKATDARGADAVAALVALGYRTAEAERTIAAVMRSADENESVEALIRKALAG